MAIDSAKIKEMIITRNIFGEAEGFLPTDLTAEKPTIAMTAAGPKVLSSIIKITATRFCILFLDSSSH